MLKEGYRVGLDIDWEYPKGEQRFLFDKGHIHADRGPSDEAEGRDLALLLQETRKVKYTSLALPSNETLTLPPRQTLNARFTQNDPNNHHPLLTIASPAGKSLPLSSST